MLKWNTVAQLHTHTHTYIYIYIYIYREREREMVDLVNPTTCEKISGKMDQPRHRKQTQE